ncbi:DUF3253 domain-containing protein [Pseudomonas sp. DC3200b2]|uniref:DUF3253 domain-containing protein n=1 Tax=Pseudomonas sp. DC3200b2 TaxID=2804669 RepID=UPI003CE750B0
MKDNAGRIQDCILELLAQRAPEASICPSEVARRLAGDDGPWRDWMAPVRHIAQDLAVSGLIEITQGAAVLPPQGPYRGPVRLRRGANFAAQAHSQQESHPFKT